MMLHNPSESVSLSLTREFSSLDSPLADEWGIILSESSRQPPVIQTVDSDPITLLEGPSFPSIRHRSTAGSCGRRQASVRTLGVLSVVAIAFFAGCGGPLGSESAVSIGGPLFAILSFILYPLFFTFPFGYVIAELCTAFPEDGGFPIAVRNAYGPFMGVQVGYWAWVSGILSAAIYPSMLFDFLVDHIPSLGSSSFFGQYCLKAVIALVLSAPSFASTKVFSRLVITFFCIVIPCVLLYLFWALPQATTIGYNQLKDVRHQNTTILLGKKTLQEGKVTFDWFNLLNSVFWNYDGVQKASVFGGQVRNPVYVYPRAITFTILLTISCYLFPMICTIASQSLAWTEFEAGSYAEAARTIGGSFLRTVMIMVNFVSVSGLFVANVFCQSTEIAGMAESNMLPMRLARRNARFHSRHHAITVTIIFTLVLVGLHTDVLLPVTNTFSGLVTIMIFLTGIQLRKLFPHIPRPTIVPGGHGVLLAISILPIAVSSVIVIKSVFFSRLVEAGIIIGFVLFGCGLGRMSYRYV